MLGMFFVPTFKENELLMPGVVVFIQSLSPIKPIVFKKNFYTPLKTLTQ